MPDVIHFDTRNANANARIHALIIGVSDYAFLPPFGTASGQQRTLELCKVDCGALSALHFADWLMKADKEGWLPQPLATIRLLLAPSAAEKAAEPRLVPYWDAAVAGIAPCVPTLDNIRRAARAWHSDCAQGQDRVSYYYFCGHGVMRDGGTTTFLARDFADPDYPPLNRSYDLNNILEGMAPSQAAPRMAMTQYYFLDCCQSISEVLRATINDEPSRILDQVLNDVDERSYPIFRATSPGLAAPAPVAAKTPFSLAITEALENGAVSGRTDNTGQLYWPVTIGDVSAAAARALKRMPDHGYRMGLQDGQADQTIVITRKPTAPLLSFRVKVFPPETSADTRVLFLRHQPPPQLVIPEGSGYPFDAQLHPGEYQLLAEIMPAGTSAHSSYVHLHGDIDMVTVRTRP